MEQTVEFLDASERIRRLVGRPICEACSDQRIVVRPLRVTCSHDPIIVDHAARHDEAVVCTDDRDHLGTAVPERIKVVESIGKVGYIIRPSLRDGRVGCHGTRSRYRRIQRNVSPEARVRAREGASVAAGITAWAISYIAIWPHICAVWKRVQYIAGALARMPSNSPGSV